MPVITALETHPRNREVIKLCLDHEAVIDLPLLQAARFQTGQVLTADQVEALAEAGAHHAAYERAIRFLSYRPRSVREVRNNLAEHGISEYQIEQVIQQLRRNEYVNDPGFARYWIENRSRFKPMAARALRYELRQKGIADDVIDAALSDYDELDAAHRAAAGRLQRFAGKTRQLFRRKMGEFLYRRGFDSGAITDVLIRLEQELEQSDLGYFATDSED